MSVTWGASHLPERNAIAMGLFDGTVLEHPVLCERCGEDIKLCQCGPADTPASSQVLKVQLEKRKRGKMVTVISGFACSATQMNDLLGVLKAKCGAGGMIDSENVELQGDHTTRMAGILAELGYRIKSAKR